jgi:hypothetical protein
MAENIVFIVDEKIESEGRKFNFIDFGIHDNVMLTDIVIEKSPTGKDYLAFTFTSEDGKQLTKTEWKPAIKDDQGHDILLSKIKNQVIRIKHIMKRYLSDEDTKVEYNYDNWVKYASAVKAKLDPVKGSAKMRIKAVYDDKGYVTLPRYVPFIESMAIPKADSKLIILSSDKKERTTGDVEVKTSNPFDTPTTEPTTFQVEAPKGNDLPF